MESTTYERAGAPYLKTKTLRDSEGLGASEADSLQPARARGLHRFPIWERLVKSVKVAI